MTPRYYRTPYTEDESIPDVPVESIVVHLPTVTADDGGQKATCACDLDMIDPRCVIERKQ